MKDLLAAVEAKNPKQMAEAFHAAIECLESDHAEAGESYDDMNAKAAKEEQE